VTSESIIQDPNLSLVAVITESEIEEEWQGLNVLDYVQREFDTKSVNLSSGDAIVNFSFVLDGEIDIEHSDIIVFVQSEDDNEIYNGNALRVSNTIEPSATNDVQFLEHAVFPLSLLFETFLEKSLTQTDLILILRRLILVR